YVALLI
ncbi:hypothetical protein D047_1754B, partial [Vibrio parahaemolyticus VPTS-2010_2]